MILVVCLSPTIQKTIELERLNLGEVNRVPATRTDASGKGINSARVIAQLGSDVTHLSQAGGQFETLFLRLARAHGIRMETVPTAAEIRFCYTLLDRSTATTTEIVEESPHVFQDVEEDLLDTFTPLVEAASVVLLTGSKAAGFTTSAFPEMVRIAKTAGARVVLDCRGDDLRHSLAHRPDVVKPNFSEFVFTFLGETIPEGRVLDENLLRRVKERMRELRTEQKIDSIITRGRHSTLFTVDASGAIGECMPESVIPRSTLGCGDSFGGALCVALEQGLTMERAVRIATAAAKYCALTPIPGSIEQPSGAIPAEEILSA